MQDAESIPIGNRFRGFLPLVVDVETGGFNPATDALLEIAVIFLRMDVKGNLYPDRSLNYHIQPFEGANLEPASLQVNGINPYHPLRIALPENNALGRLFKAIREAIRENECTRAILVGHNAGFDLGFLNAAVSRAGIKRNPFHPFSSFDTVTLGAMAYGQTVLSRILQAADIPWDSDQAHSALYDARKTAELFYTVMNRWHEAVGGYRHETGFE